MSGELARVEWEADRHRVDGTPIRLRFSAWRVDWDGAPAEQIVVTDGIGPARIDDHHARAARLLAVVLATAAAGAAIALCARTAREAQALGPLLFTLGADPQLRNTHLQPVGDAPGRRLLYAAANPTTSDLPHTTLCRHSVDTVAPSCDVTPSASFSRRISRAAMSVSSCR